MKLSDNFKLQEDSTIKMLIFSILSVIGSSDETSEDVCKRLFQTCIVLCI